MLEKKHASEHGLAEAPPHYYGHGERLRDRFREAGAEALSDYELLELVLFRALPRRDVKPLAKQLISTFGSFAEVISAPVARLTSVKGLGDAAITELKLVQAAASRLVRGEVKKTAGALVLVGSAGLLPHRAGVCRSRAVSRAVSR